MALFWVTVFVKRNYNRSFSDLYRIVDLWPMGNSIVCHISALTLRQCERRRRPSSAAVRLGNVPNNGPVRLQTHHQLPVNEMDQFYCCGIRVFCTYTFLLTVVSRTSVTFGARTWIGRGSVLDANTAPSLPNVMMQVRQPRQRILLMARLASLHSGKKQKNKSFNTHTFGIHSSTVWSNTHSRFGTGRLVIEAASTWLIHSMLGSEKSSILVVVGAGAAFNIEMPCLKRLNAAKVACSGVSNWQTKTCVSYGKQRIQAVK